MFAESLALLEEIRSGARLPQTSSEQNRPPETHGVRRGLDKGGGEGRSEKDGERERRRRRVEREVGRRRKMHMNTAAVTCGLLSYCRVPPSLATAFPCMTPGTSR